MTIHYFYYMGPLELLPENVCSIPVLIDTEIMKIFVDPVLVREFCTEYMVWNFDEDWLIINKLSGKFNLVPWFELSQHYTLIFG